ncbi:MAG: S-methyl-5'-thioadenosine phosphorylase [Acidobacteriota bacterium]
MARATIGIIGGSGLYQMEGLSAVESVQLETPFGKPSDAIRVGSLEGRQVAFLARHGAGHKILPTEINYRANIYALKSLGVERILSASAVGSMREEIHPMDLVIPDQFIDRTRHRADTFFGHGIAAHVSFADPVCGELRRVVGESARGSFERIHPSGTYLCMEGPQFSTRAESHMYRSWGVHVIGMTNLTEAKLAREAEICYATLALVTDYDCWREHGEEVSVETVISYLTKNARAAQDVIRRVVAAMPQDRSCPCGKALATAIITDRTQIPAARMKELSLLIGRYVN